MENVSVKHWVASATCLPPAPKFPFNISSIDVEVVDGPVMTKELNKTNQVSIVLAGWNSRIPCGGPLCLT